jgi:predicted phage terminase large subunit-like protein
MLAAYPPGWLREQELNGAFVDRGSVLGDPSWFDDRIISAIPEDVSINRRIRFWDLAATEKKMGFGYRQASLNDPDETVGTLMSWDGNESFYIEDQVGGYWEWDDIKKHILQTAKLDGPMVKIYLEQEPGAGGKNQVAALAEYIREELPNWPTVVGQKPEGDKVMRANIWFAEASRKNFWMIRGAWNNGFLDQLGSFPIGRHDDKIDSVSGARLVIAPIARWKNIEFLAV